MRENPAGDLPRGAYRLRPLTLAPACQSSAPGTFLPPESARAMLEETGCDAVMFARGAMGNPFIFRQARELLETGSYGEIPADTRMASGWRELHSLAEDSGEVVACREMRKRFCSYSKGIKDGAVLRTELVRASDDRRVPGNSCPITAIPFPRIDRYLAKAYACV